MQHGPYTHQAWLHSDIYGRCRKSVVLFVQPRRAQCQNFRMPGWVVRADRGVVRAPDDSLPPNDDRPYWDLPFPVRPLRGTQCQLHEVLVNIQKAASRLGVHRTRRYHSDSGPTTRPAGDRPIGRLCPASTDQLGWRGIT